MQYVYATGDFLAPKAMSAARDLLEQYSGESVSTVEKDMHRQGIDDNRGYIQVGETVIRTFSQHRTQANMDKYEEWTTNTKYFNLDDPTVVEDMLPTFDIYWANNRAYLINIKKAYRLGQAGKLTLTTPNARFKAIKLNALRDAGCIPAEMFY